MTPDLQGGFGLVNDLGPGVVPRCVGGRNVAAANVWVVGVGGSVCAVNH